MEETNFDRLLHRYLRKELNPEEEAKFSAWLDILEKENDRDLEMSHEAREQLFQKITNRVSTVDEVIALYPRKPLVVRLFSHSWVQVAATVLIMISVTLGVRYLVMDSSEGKLAASREKMILADGTIVWINQSGDFGYYEKDGGRYATFTGEALFEVAKDPNSPFTISCGNIHVTVRGTSFILKADTAQIELEVLTGKVNVASATDKIGVDVAPHEKIIYSSAGLVARLPLSTDEISAIAANTEYNMKFQGDTMANVVRSIAKKFNVTIEITNENLNKCHVSADFTDHSLEDTLSILADLLDVSYRITGKKVELSGAGC